MKEIMAIVRMKKTGATKKALIAAGVAGFTAVKVLGRGNPGNGSKNHRRVQREIPLHGNGRVQRSGRYREDGEQFP